MQGASLSVLAIAYGTYNTGNVFTAQLSDASGSFTSPVTIGTLTATASGSIPCTIDGAQAIGNAYRIRVVSSDPAVNGINNGSNLSILAPINYYYDGSGPLEDKTNWGTNTNGTGTNPPDFISAGQLFNIRNTSAVTTTAAWTVTGTGSKIIVGDPSVAPVTLTIASGSPITTNSPAVLDITAASSGSNRVLLQDVTPSAISFGTMAATSEVHYQATLSTSTTKTFGNLYVDGAGTTTTFTGTPVIQTALTVASGSTMATGNNSGNYITINSGASVTINGTFQTQKTAGFTSANQATTSSGGAIQFISSENLTLGSDSVIEYNRVTSGSTTFQIVTPRTDYKNLTISTTGTIPTVTLAGATTVSGVLTVNPYATLNSAGFLTLKSDSNGTARVATILGTSPAVGNITGNVTVERYIPGKRAWRALTAPVIGTSANSIFVNWQNAGMQSAGTGVELWSTTGGNGMGTGPNNSILKYNSSGTSGAWNAVTNTNDNLFESTVNNAFMVFVTGPYATSNTNVATGFANTTLRATGALIVGQKDYAGLPSGVHTLIGNPYACPISPSLLLTGNTNFGNNLWIWDAKATGNFGVGAYNTYDKTANQYTNITNATPLATTPDIQSGQAFFVKATSGTATFTILESYKTSVAANTTVLRTGTPPELVRVGLYKQENNEWNGRDGAMTVLLADADANQAPNKMNNGSENIVFTKNGASFASNHHLPLVASDVLNVKVWNATVGANYKLKINTEDFVTPNLDATLEDLFTNTRTPLALDGTAVEYPFTVTADALSTGDRFRIVFQSSTLGTNNPKANGFSIVPNPVTGDGFQVNLGALPAGNYTYTICNTLGQEVEKGSINNAAQNTNYEVKMSNSATGIYLMKIKGSDNSVFTAKIIKK